MKKIMTLLLMMFAITAYAQYTPDYMSRQPRIWDFIAFLGRSYTYYNEPWHAPLETLLAMPHRDYDNEEITAADSAMGSKAAGAPMTYRVTVDSGHGYFCIEEGVQMPQRLELTYWKKGRDRQILINRLSTSEGPGGTEDPVVQEDIHSLLFEVLDDGTTYIQRQVPHDDFFADIISQHPDVEFTLPRRGLCVRYDYVESGRVVTKYVKYNRRKGVFEKK